MKTKKKNQLSALDVANYLLSLDPQRKYFTLWRIPTKKDWGNPPVEGNFRLNKLLHILQILHYVKYRKFLFSENLIAYKHGGVVQEVSKSFSNELYHQYQPRTKNLNSQEKEFIKIIFEYFKEYTNEELWQFSHDDPSWQLAWEKGYNVSMSKEPRMRAYWRNFYGHIMEEIEENGVTK